MSGVPSAFILVVVVDLVVLLGVAIVLDLVVVVADLVAAGTWVVLVAVIFDELLLIVVVAGVVWAWAERPPATAKAAKRVKRRFMKIRWVKRVMPKG